MPNLTLRGLSKTFPGQAALDNVSLDVVDGEIHALVGQNGSGKSTLIKILAGYHEPDAGGYAELDGAELKLGDAAAAFRAGLRFVHQDLGLVETLSAVENLALGRGYETGRAGRIKWKAEFERARVAMERLGFFVDLRSPVSTLGAAERSAVAIARALHDEGSSARLLVLDEPTASLAANDVLLLFRAMRRLRNQGRGILFVSHHLDEIFEIADRVTVLRDGRNITTVRISEVDHDQLVELVIGRAVQHRRRTAGVADVGSARFEVEDVSGANVERLDLRVAAGEVVGVAGLNGSGRESVVSLLSGRLPRSGVVMVEGRLVPPAIPRAALRLGVVCATGERALYGIIGPMTVRENLTLGDVRRNVRRLRLRHVLEREEVKSWIRRLGIVTRGPDDSITALSGGNQQKVLLARILRLSPKVLLLDQPTEGVDVGAKEEIHSLIDAAAREGAAVVVASTESKELVRICDRVVVLWRGEVVRVLRGDEITVEDIEHAQLAVDAPVGGA